MQAKGMFEVKMIPTGAENKAEGSNLGRMSLDKRYEGDLEAAGNGEMLSAMTDTKGSAGYVAIERVVGTLHGHSGSFVLQHTGVMNRGQGSLSITVVPDSGSAQLAGLTGSMSIQVDGGKHFYQLEYTLPEKS